MANPIFAYQDLSLYTLSATSTDSLYPLTNIQTYYADQVWKSAVLSTSTNPQYFIIDFGVATTVDTLVLDGYAFANADSGFPTLQGATDSGFTAGVVTFLGGQIDPTVGIKPAAYFTFTSTSRRYWRLNIPNAGFASNPNQITIGNIFLCSRLDFGYPYNFPYKNTARKYQTIESVALDGRVRMAQTYGGRKFWEFDLTLLPDTTKATFVTLFSTTRGKLRPFYFIDTDGTTVNYVYLDMDYDPSETQRFNVNNLKKIVLKSQLTS